MNLRTAAILFLVPAVAYAGATASAFRPEHRQGANLYNAQSAIDSDPATAWMVPGESPNRGEWIQLDLPKATVDKIGMTIGWAKTTETFTDYARIKTVKVEAFSQNDQQEYVPAGSTTAEFKDSVEWQVVDITDLAVGEALFGGKIKISVVDIYPGSDYPNLGMSEMLLYLTEFDTDVTLGSDMAAVGADVMANALDDNPKTLWVVPSAGASFTAEAQGFGVSSIGIQSLGKTYARPKTVEVKANNRTVRSVLGDSDSVQYATVPTITGYTGGAFGTIEVKVIDTWPGTAPEQNMALAEISSKGTNYEGF